MAIDPELLEILACPKCKEDVKLTTLTRFREIPAESEQNFLEPPKSCRTVEVTKKKFDVEAASLCMLKLKI